MESKQRSSPHRVYEDYEPPFEWANEQGSETLVIYLPGFRKDQMRVQVTSSGNLRVSGERQLGESKWRRFMMEVPLPSNCDINGIAAKFESGMLYVKLPKKTTLVETQDQKEKSQSSKEATKPQPKEELQQGQKGSAAAQEVTSKASKDKQQTNEKGAVGDTNAKKDKELSEGRTGSDANSVVKRSAQEKENSGGLGEPEKKDHSKSPMPEKHETLGGSAKDEGKQRPTEDSYKKVVGPVSGWVTAVKARHKPLSWVVSALLVLILALYIRKVIIKTSGESASQEF